MVVLLLSIKIPHAMSSFVHACPDAHYFPNSLHVNVVLKLISIKRPITASSDTRQPKISPETIALIKEMASTNRLWGAERIRGELLKLGIRVCKRTIQKYMRGVRTPRPTGQSWQTFLRNHGGKIWACDFLHVTDLFFRSLFAFSSSNCNRGKSFT